MVFDQDDNFYSATGNSVQQYSPNFDHLLTIPIEGTVGGIAVSENGYLYVTSATTHKIFRVKLGERAPPPEARLSAEILPVVTIDGALGRAYSIQASESLGANWQTLDVIQMTKPTETWIDRTSLKGHRFYRAVLVE